jgi:hypothetical protein
MVDNFEELVVLILQTCGMKDAVLTYEEETGASRVEATMAVRELVRRDNPDRTVRRIYRHNVTSPTPATMGGN